MKGENPETRKKLINKGFLAPRAGFEPATNRLTVDCSTTELPGNLYRKTICAFARCALNKGTVRFASTNQTELDTILPFRLPRPSTKLGRNLLGGVLIVGGLLGFLPVLGFWMIPLGLLILSQDFATIRRFRRNWTVKIMRWWDRRKAPKVK